MFKQLFEALLEANERKAKVYGIPFSSEDAAYVLDKIFGGRGPDYGISSGWAYVYPEDRLRRKSEKDWMTIRFWGELDLLVAKRLGQKVEVLEAKGEEGFPSGGKYQVKTVDGTKYVDTNQPADIAHRYDVGKKSAVHHAEQEKRSKMIEAEVTPEHIKDVVADLSRDQMLSMIEHYYFSDEATKAIGKEYRVALDEELRKFLEDSMIQDNITFDELDDMVDYVVRSGKSITRAKGFRGVVWFLPHQQ